MGRTAKKEKVIWGSGNVFADLGFENADELLAKSRLVTDIAEVIRSKRLTQAKVAERIGIDQPAVSKLLRGRTEGYSIDRLIRILNSLGQDVEIKISAKPVGARRGSFVISSKSRKTLMPEVNVVRESSGRYSAPAAKKK